MSVISGGTALKGFSAGGSRSGSAGSAGTSIILRRLQLPLSRCHNQIEAERSLVEITTPTNP